MLNFCHSEKLIADVCYWKEEKLLILDISPFQTLDNLGLNKIITIEQIPI